MAIHFSDQKLLDYSREHLLHELSMLWQTDDALQRHAPGTVEYVALLESFATHLRALIEFFYFGENGEYVRAKHFLDDAAAWTPTRPAEANKLHGRASNEVSHLTTGRKSGNPPEKEWYTGDALALVDSIAKEFASKASAKKLHPQVLEFLNVPADQSLLWITENVSHRSNVHVQVMSSTCSFSTATVLRGGKILKTP